ncbi:MAG TPA: exonuclease sbcCD subunit D [Cytophagales bacterium]|nr:exonuclease sbcCD subunit D [Cytophagales bacterium]HAA23901.1 exonuclease sbcCD subunit D [Cytophagales bacterium]HAP60615.1 exonuclease sbcCD subunit D [Cytophagales bacterium]
MGFRFLHTADWHLGKRLHGKELQEDHRLFFDWLIEEISERNIQLVLVSGDVFDLANPSSEARRLYYQILLKLHQMGCHVIVTGGNHDSPQVLNAPQTLLTALGVDVVGGLPPEYTQALFPIEDDKGHTVAVVAAIPYLRDADLRSGRVLQEDQDRLDTVKSGIASVFQGFADQAEKDYPNLPLIGMGHLFAHGAVTSDSEREIQVGNLAGFEANRFPSTYQYLALGHIHRPQQIGGTDRIQYSGSPIALSFSERTDKKRVIVGELAGSDLTLTSVPVPPIRGMKRLKGDLESIRNQLKSFGEIEEPLPTLIEIELTEPQYDPQRVVDLETLVLGWEHPKAEILKYRVSFGQQITGAHELFEQEVFLEDLKPREMLERKIEQEELPKETQAQLFEAFDEILEEVYQEQEGEA